MALTRHERKEQLGHGAVAEIARRTGRSEGHVSQVLNCEKTGRRDRKVEVAAARMLNKPVDEVFPAAEAEVAS